jgi:hypothetical protein
MLGGEPSGTLMHLVAHLIGREWRAVPELTGPSIQAHDFCSRGFRYAHSSRPTSSGILAFLLRLHRAHAIAKFEAVCFPPLAKGMT